MQRAVQFRIEQRVKEVYLMEPQETRRISRDAESLTEVGVDFIRNNVVWPEIVLVLCTSKKVSQLSSHAYVTP